MLKPPVKHYPAYFAYFPLDDQGTFRLTVLSNKCPQCKSHCVIRQPGQDFTCPLFHYAEVYLGRTIVGCGPWDGLPPWERNPKP